MKPFTHLPGRSPRPGCLLLLLGLTALLAAPTGFAQTTTNATAASDTARNLIVVDVSSNMRRRAANVEATLTQLFLTGFNDQLKLGDTLGLWTYNERLNAGSFPLQVWRTEHRQRIAGLAVDFLRKQKYEKRSVPEVALQPMQQVIKNSGKITVLILSDGERPFSGTPFDAAINDYFKQHFSAQRAARMPFITILRAVNGEYVGHTVNLAPFTPEYPAFPPEPVTEVVAALKPVAPAKPAPRVVSPLIVVGKKPESDSSLSTVLPQPQPLPPAASADDLPLPGPGEPGRVISVRELSDPALEVTASSAARAPESTPEASATTRAPANKPTPPAAPATPSPSAPPVIVNAPAQTPVVTAAPAEQTSPATVAAPTAESVAAPPTSTPTAPATGGESAVAPPLAQATAVLPSSASNLRLWLLVAGAGLLGLVLGVAIMLLQRSRALRHASLITQSMDRHRKAD